MSQPHSLNAERVKYTLYTRVFGATDSPALMTKFEDSVRDLLAPIERAFVNDSAVTAALGESCIAQKAASFVTFSPDRNKMRRWELSADIRVITPDLPGRPGAVEASLQSLSRDFGACIAIPLLYGQDFLDRSPRLLDELWKFDNDVFPFLMIGVPPWLPVKLIKDGVAARSRLIQDLEALFRRVDQYQRGDVVDFGADLSDISKIALEHNSIYNRTNWPYRDRGASELVILWGQNANTQPTLFWVLVYIYCTPGLLVRVRDEIAPHVTISQTVVPEITSIDLAALSRACPLLKACVFETYRLSNDPVSIRYVARPMTIDDGMCKHNLSPGTFVSAPLSLIQHDPSVYTDPDKFMPERFLGIDAESGKMVARYGRLKPWGAGTSMCKGRTLAEKQIMSLSAAIISLWEIAPAAGRWDVPAMVPGTGVKKPVKDIRVVIRRRVF